MMRALTGKENASDECAWSFAGSVSCELCVDVVCGRDECVKMESCATSFGGVAGGGSGGCSCVCDSVVSATWVSLKSSMVLR